MWREGFGFLFGVVVAAVAACGQAADEPCVRGGACGQEGFACQESGCSSCVCTSGHFSCTDQGCIADGGPHLKPPVLSWWPSPMWLVAGESTTIDVTITNLFSQATATVSLSGLPGTTTPQVATLVNGNVVASVPLDIPASAPLGHVAGTVTAELSAPVQGVTSVSAPFEAFIGGAVGSFDPTFGEHGCVQIADPRGVRPLADGTIIVGGNAGASAFVQRLTANGATDTTFGDFGAFELANASMVSFDVTSDGRTAFSFEGGVAIVDAGGTKSTTVATEPGPVACRGLSTIVPGQHVVSTIDASGQLTTGAMPLSLTSAPQRAFFAADGAIFLPVAPSSIGKITGQLTTWATDPTFGNAGIAPLAAPAMEIGGSNAGDLFVALGPATTGLLTHVDAKGVASSPVSLAQWAGPIAYDELTTTLLVGASGGSITAGAFVTRVSTSFATDASFGFDGVLGLPLTGQPPPMYEVIDSAHRLYVAIPGVLCRVRLQ